LLGFGAGQWAGESLQVGLLRVGQVQMLAGIAGAVIALFLGRLVWRPGASMK
jgi:hypothetical protein